MCHFHSLNKPKLSGFTLIELMITITVAGILATLAMPSFRDFILNQQIKNASFDMVGALTFARSEAIKRNTDVTLQKAGAAWKDGWAVGAGGVVFREWGPYPSLDVSANPDAAVTFYKNGRADSSPTFKVNDNLGNSAVPTRCVTLELSGRPSTRVSLVDGSCS